MDGVGNDVQLLHFSHAKSEDAGGFVDSFPRRSYAPFAQRRGSQVVRQRSAKPLFVGSIPAPAFPTSAPNRMKVKAHRAFARFRRKIEQHQELMRPWKGMAYRVTTLDYPSPENILRGEGSFLYGGRWNAPGAFRAVYGSTTDIVAVAESRATAEYAGIPFPFRTPRLIVSIELDLPKVIDLGDPQTLQALEISAAEFCSEDWRKVRAQGCESFSQAFGRAVFECGGSALLAPSAKVRGGINVVYLPENRCQMNEAQVCEPEKLDRITSIEEQ